MCVTEARHREESFYHRRRRREYSKQQKQTPFQFRRNNIDYPYQLKQEKMTKAKKRESQFAGAAALFRQQEKDLLKKQASMSVLSPKPGISPRPSLGTSPGGTKISSMSNILISPPIAKKKQKNKRFSLEAPPFVSPGAHTSKANQATTLNSTPENGKPKVKAKSWKDKLSFQAESPLPSKRASVGTLMPQHYGGSYLDKSPKPSRQSVSLTPLEQTPDIKIEVKIPDIDKKIRLRKAKAANVPEKKQDDNVPEHIRKFREREANRKKAEELKLDKAARQLQAYLLGWKARAAYPRLLEDNRERLDKMRAKEARKKLVINSYIKIQSTFRMFVRRKRYLYVLECKRRREKNIKEIKRIEKKVQKIPKQTKLDIKNMKQEYSEKKKQLKRYLRKQAQEEEEKIQEMKKEGKDMVKHLHDEGEKLKEQIERYKQDSKVLKKQFEILSQKSEETSKNFKSLQAFVKKKDGEIKEHEIGSQKCRHRYLPRYRKELADRNKHCIAEVRVKNLYKTRLHRIISELERTCANKELVNYAKNDVQGCEDELEALPIVPVPDSLWAYLES